MSGRAACVTTVCDAMRGWSVRVVEVDRTRAGAGCGCGLRCFAANLIRGNISDMVRGAPATHQVLTNVLTITSIDVGPIASPCSTDVFEARAAIMGLR